VELAPFSLYYDIDQSAIPLETEVERVVAVTNDFVQNYFSQRYSDLESVKVDLVQKEFTFGQPYRIDFAATAAFRPDATPPPQSELNQVLTDAFSGNNLIVYISVLQRLEGTIFNTIKEVNENSASPQGSRFSLRVSIASAACVFAIMLSGLFLCRHRQKFYAMEQKGYNAANNTVAGDTYKSTVYEDSPEEGNTNFYARTYEERDSSIFDSSESQQLETGVSKDEVSVTERSDRTDPWGALKHRPLHGRDAENDNSVQSSPYLEDAIISPPSQDPLQHEFGQLSDSRFISPNTTTMSEDEDVPLRVVDLIKRFSSSMR
jgi:hypothetical protein